jgi:hypothetical protein
MAVVREWAWVPGGLDFEVEAGDFWADAVTSAEVMWRIKYYPYRMLKAKRA